MMITNLFPTIPPSNYYLDPFHSHRKKELYICLVGMELQSNKQKTYSVFVDSYEMITFTIHNSQFTFTHALIRTWIKRSFRGENPLFTAAGECELCELRLCKLIRIGWKFYSEYRWPPVILQMLKRTNKNNRTWNKTESRPNLGYCQMA